MGENRDKMLITFLGSSWQRGHVKLIFVADLDYEALLTSTPGLLYEVLSEMLGIFKYV